MSWWTSLPFFKTGGGSLRRQKRRWRLHLELLEERLAPAAVTGSWVFQGPTVIENGQVLTANNQDPVIGAVNTVLPDTADITGNTLYITTTNGGIWKTTSAYAATPSWTSLNANLPDQAVTDLQFDPSDSTHLTLFAGTGTLSNGELPSAPLFTGPAGPPGMGILQSTNGGATWSPLDESSNPFQGRTIRVVLPTLQNGSLVLLAGTYNRNSPLDATDGLWRGTLNGSTWDWTRISGSGGANTLPNAPVNDLIQDPSDATGMTYYLATNGVSTATPPLAGVYRSTDGGKVWARYSNGISDAVANAAGNLRLALNASGAKPVLYVGIVNYSTGDLQAVYRRNENDASPAWVSMGLPTYGSSNQYSVNSGDNQGLLNFTMVADPSNPNLVYVGGDTLGTTPILGYNDYYGVHARGTFDPSTSMSTWVYDQGSYNGHAGNNTNNTAPHADSRDLVFDPMGNLLEGDDGGIYRLSNASGLGSGIRQWSALIGSAAPSLGNTEVYSASYEPFANLVIGGAQDVGAFVQSAAGSTVFQEELEADGAGVVSAIDPVTGFSFNYLQGNDGNFSRLVYDTSGNLVTSLSKHNFATSGFPNPNSDPFAYAVNPVDPNQMLLQMGGKVYNSSDGGVSATLAFTVPGGHTVGRLAFGGSSAGTANPGVAYAGTDNGEVWFRQYASADWTKQTAYTGGQVWDLQLDEQDYNTAFVLNSSGKLFRTTDHGQGFTDVTGNLTAVAGVANQQSPSTNYFSTIDVIPLSVNQADVAVVVGGFGGVYAAVHPDSSSQWVRLGLGLPGVMVSSVHYDSTDNLLVAGTFGRGTWTLSNALDQIIHPALPTITLLPPTLATAHAGQAYSQTFTGSGGTSYTYSESGALPAGMSFTAAGVLSGTPTTLGSFPITITVTDSSGAIASQAYTLDVGLALSPGSLAAGTVSQNYSQQITASGGTGPYTFSVYGTLPAGIGLSTTGLLSGTPTQSGAVAFTVTASDSNGKTGSQSYALTIDPAITFPTTTGTSSGSNTATKLKDTTQAWTPDQWAGNTVQIMKGTGAGQARLITSNTATELTLASAWTTIPDSTSKYGIGLPAVGTISQPYSQQIIVSGGSGAYTFSESGTLPAGIHLSATGLLSGTPTQVGRFPFTVTVSDGTGKTGSQWFSLTIDPVVKVSLDSFVAHINQAYSRQVTVAGGSGPYTFSASGSLPAGISLSATGLLSGTPTQLGPFPITVTATDSNGVSGSQAFTLEVLDTNVNFSNTYTPQQVITAYGIDQIPIPPGSLRGAGQTIALVESSYDTNFVPSTDPKFSTSALHLFDQAYNLPDPPSFTIIGYDPKTDSPISLTDPSISKTSSNTEFAMDVEWAHAIAPGANILVVVHAGGNEALLRAMNFAGRQGASVVSASFAQAEFQGETNFDSLFTTPGVTYLASAGDGKHGYGHPFPSHSANVISVSATTLTLLDNGSYGWETAWAHATGGTSLYEPEPAYQSQVNTTGFRNTPDVSFLGSSTTGVYILDNPSKGFVFNSGTSLSSPSWAGLIAIANQLRADADLPPLTSHNQTLPQLYALPRSDFHNITALDDPASQNSNDPRSATSLNPNYNLFTGLGSPIANLLVPDLANVAAADHLVIHAPSQASAGGRFTVSVAAVDPRGIVNPRYSGWVALSLTDAPTGGKLSGVTIAPFQNGVATFSDLSLNVIGGGYSLLAVSSGDLVSATASMTVAAAPVMRLKITGLPVSTTAGQQISFTVTAVNALNQTDTQFLDTVQFTSTDGQFDPFSYTFLAADHGTKTFTVTLKTAGVRTITVTDTVRPTLKATSAGVTVHTADASTLSVTGYPTTDVSGVAHSFTVTARDAYGNRAGSYRGTVQFISSDAQASLPQPYTFTAADNGAHAFSATLTSLGSQSLRAADTVTDAISGTQAGIMVVSPATRLRITGMPARVTAGQPFTITVTAVNAANQTDTLFRDAIHFTSNDGQALLPVDYTFFPGDNGSMTFTVTLKTAGARNITVIDTSRPTIKGTSVAIPVAPAAVSTVSVTGFPSPTLAGAAHAFTVTARDAYGNRVGNYRGRVHFSSSDAQAVLPLDYTFSAADNGAHTFRATLNASGSQALSATDAATPSISGTQTNITVGHLTAGVTGPLTGVRGQPLTFTLTASETDQPAVTPFSYRIDWDGNGSVDQIVYGPSGLTVSHAYPATGANKIKVTVVDSVGNVSPQAAMLPVTIQVIALQSDPADTTKTALVVGGTTGNDVIIISPLNVSGQTVSVSINGVVQPGGPFAPSGHILVYGQNGDDVIRVSGTLNGQPVPIAIPSLLFGGAGNDTLSVAGSNVNNVLVASAGNDVLTGGNGRDIQIGGTGKDSLRAGGSDNVLVGGSTSYDTDPAALLALMAEWARTDRPYQGRVQDLFGNGAGGLNGTYLLNPQTVMADSDVDRLFGGAGLDWFWMGVGSNADDTIKNYGPGEVATFEASSYYLSPYAIRGLNPTFTSGIGTISGPGRLRNTATRTTPTTASGLNPWYDQRRFAPLASGTEVQVVTWGPQSLLQTAPTLPIGVVPGSSASAQFHAQRLITTTTALIGTSYQHHHDPLWNPYANGYQSSNASAFNYWPWSAVSSNPISNLYTPTQQADGTWKLLGSTFINPYYPAYAQGDAGLDCSDLTALAYNVAAGIYIDSDVGHQGVVNAMGVYSGTSPLGWNNSASTVFVDPKQNTAPAITPITPQFYIGPNSRYNSSANSRYITQFNTPGSLDSIINQLQPGDLLYIAASPGASSSVTHVVTWLGAYGTLADGSPSPVPLVISSHDNTPAVLDANGNMPPPGVHILPFNSSSWFYTNFSHAMRVLPAV